MLTFEHLHSLDFSAPLPSTLLEISQTFETPCLADVVTATRHALHESGLLAQIQPGQTVALGVGSRGITNLAAIVRSVVETLKNVGAQPFIIPAMGSHAGATPTGQTEMLAHLGITEASVGAEIRASMDVHHIGTVPDGPPLYQDVIAASADHTLLINRIKPHTSFHGPIESGLAKMTVIGLGNQRGAATMHSRGMTYLREAIAPAITIYAERTNLRGGLAIVENAQHQTTAIVGLQARDIGGPRETELLNRAKTLMPGLPFAAIDVLVVRQMGKNISGTGMDTNVIGRVKVLREPEPSDGPDIAVIAVLDLTSETHGNAHGIGLANVTTWRVARQIDWAAMYANAISAGVCGMERDSLPLTMPNDYQALSAAVRGCGQPAEAARFVFIDDTLSLTRMWASESLRLQVEAHPRLAVLSETPLTFDAEGCMQSPWGLAGSR